MSYEKVSVAVTQRRKLPSARQPHYSNEFSPFLHPQSNDLVVWLVAIVRPIAYSNVLVKTALSAVILVLLHFDS